MKATGALRNNRLSQWVVNHKFKVLVTLVLAGVVGISFTQTKRISILMDTGVAFAIHNNRDKSIDHTRANTGVVGAVKDLDAYADTQSMGDDGLPLIKGIVSTQEAVELQSAAIAHNNSATEDPEHSEWLRSHGGDSSNKYSVHDQITPENVDQLKLAWKFESFSQKDADEKWRTNVEVNPVFADGVIYAVTPDRKLVALAAETGKLIWAFNSGKQPSDRGLLYWQDKERGLGPYIFLAVGDSVFCIDAKTGKRVEAFGGDGWVETGVVRAAPVVFEDKLILATIRPVGLIAINISDGEVAWRKALHPENKNFVGATPWSGNSLDRERGLFYVSTGNPRPALFGADRPGPNRNSNSVLAIDLRSQKIKWAFQEVSHDLWDLDVPSPPLLTSIFINGKKHDVVITVTKIGNTLILDRDTGQPLYDVPFAKAPSSTIAGEIPSAYQPDIKIPEPFIDFRFDPSHVTQRTDQANQDVKRQLKGAVYGWFEPPALGKSLILYGLHGGAEWAGGAVDPVSQTLYVPVNQVPWKIRVYLTSEQPAPKSHAAGVETYKSNCAECHGNLRNGNYKTKGEADVNFVPSLVGITKDPQRMTALQKQAFNTIHNNQAKASDINAIQKMLIDWDEQTFQNKAAKVNFLWSQLLDPDGYPGTQPPWGKIVAINLVGGKIAWESPFGYIDDGLGLRKVGTQNYGGLIATRGGLIFATGTDDKRLTAVKASTGEELWNYGMDAAGSAPPMTFKWKNKQYVVAVATGGRFHNYKEKAGAIYAFAIDGPEK